MKQSRKMGSIVALTLISILLALSGMAAMTSAIGETPPNMFYGYVTLNDESVPAGITVSAYISEELRGSCAVDGMGVYSLGVTGNESDEGETVTFRICGVLADENATWHASSTPVSRRLDLSAEDYEAPAVTDPNANPSAIAANGAQLSRLNVTVTDNCTIDTVTVNLSAIGGSDAQVMEHIGGDVYSTITNASVGTADGTYYLQVNASDIAGNYDDSVIVLEIVPGVEVMPKTGDINGDGDLTTSDAIYLAKHVIGLSGYETIYADGNINGDGDLTTSDAIYLAKHVIGLSGYETIYP